MRTRTEFGERLRGWIDLSVPELPERVSPPAAALAYVKAGWYVGPVKPGTKNPGSLLGGEWPEQTTGLSADVESYWRRWLDAGVFLHAGQSFAVIFDVDHPDKVPDVLTEAIERLDPPFQSTRRDVPGKGHYVFSTGPVRNAYGNATGQLGTGWGEVRCKNGVVIAEPSEHRDADDGGCYRWLVTGPAPYLPDELADALSTRATRSHNGTRARNGSAPAEVAPLSLAETRRFVEAHPYGKPKRLKGILAKLDAEIEQGRSRHDAARDALIWAMKEAHAGIVPADAAVRAIHRRFEESFE